MMKMATKTALIVACLLCVAGLVCCAVALFSVGFDLRKLSNERYVVNAYEAEGVFDEIEIQTDISNVTFTLSEDGACRVVCHEREKVKHDVKVENGRLVIGQVDTRKWYDHIGISFGGDASVVVYLPQAQYGRLTVDTDTGDIRIPENISFDNLEIKTSTGDVSVCGGTRTDRIQIATSTGDIMILNVACTEMSFKTSTGEVELKNIVADASLQVRTSTGDVEFERIDASSITVETSTGDVEGTLLSPKRFSVDTSTGDVEVPGSEGDQICRITTSTGDVEIDVIG